MRCLTILATGRWPIALVMLVLGFASLGQPVLSAQAVNAADWYNPKLPTCGIQEAIDSLGPHGGTVTLPPGRYLLKRSINLPSNVTLAGSGPSTILTRGQEVMSLLTEVAEEGQQHVVVESSEGFEVGAEVGVLADKLGGWLITHAIIEAINGNTLQLDRPLCNTYCPTQRGRIINYFPMITIEKQKNIVVRDIAIDGNISNNPGSESDFTFAAIHLHNASDAYIINCTVLEYPSDGIGVQGGQNIKVSGCTVSRCRGNGFHPGTSVNYAVFSDNTAHHNSSNGLYFCANVRYLIASDNLFHHNGGSGIGGVGGGGDQYNVLVNNVSTANGRHGIEAEYGTENIIANNVCLNNSQSSPGEFFGISLRNTTHTTVTGNRCLDDQEHPSQTCGIGEALDADHNLIASNHIAGLVVVGRHTEVYGNLLQVVPEEEGKGLSLWSRSFGRLASLRIANVKVVDILRRRSFQLGGIVGGLAGITISILTFAIGVVLVRRLPRRNRISPRSGCT